MASTPDWAAWEGRIAGLLPGDGPNGAFRDRAVLLGEMAAYARAVVREARRDGASMPTHTERERALGWLARPVFLCGHHRTGTTLLCNLLDGHPELVVLPSEGTYFTSFAYACVARPSRDDVDRFIADWIERLIDPNYAPHFRLGGTRGTENPSVHFARRVLGWHRELVAALPARAPFALLLSLLAAFQDVTQTAASPRAWVEKTPLNERYAARLASAFPEARFVQMVRDPAATLASVLELYRNIDDPEGAGGHARAIARSFDWALRNGRRWPERYRVIRYEDLVDDLAAQVARLRDFLGLSPDATLTTPTVLGVPVRANSSFDPGQPGTVQRSRGTKSLSPREQLLIDALAARRAARFGYPAKQLPRWVRLKASFWEDARHAARGAKARISALARRG